MRTKKVRRFFASGLILTGASLGLWVGSSFLRAKAQAPPAAPRPPGTAAPVPSAPPPTTSAPPSASGTLPPAPGTPPPVPGTQPPVPGAPPAPTMDQVPQDLPPTNGGPPAEAQPTSGGPNEIPPGSEGTIRTNVEGFIYNPEGLRDPFFPLRKRGDRDDVPKITDNPKPTEEQFDPKDPLQAFELREYRLVAVMWDVREPRAMVASPDGKIWTIRQKVRLGRAGAVVAAIRESEIVVVEPNPDGSYVNASTRVISMKK